MRCKFTTELAEKLGFAKDRFPKTPQEIASAQDALVKELGRLSMEEHERILFDIHGIDTTAAAALSSPGCGENYEMNFDPEAHVDNLLQEFDDEIRKLPGDKSAFELAMYLNEEYVNNKQFRLMFLRAERYNTRSAAECIIAHFQRKREIFGDDEILARDICLEDLTQDEVTCLESGFIQLLPNRDGSGRAVVFVAPGKKRTGYSDKDFESLSRQHWYFFHSILRDEETQKKGIVSVIYNVGKYGRKEGWTFMRRMHTFHDGVPINLVACHVCFNDESAHGHITGVKLFLNEEARNRCKTHIYSNPKEIEFQLQTFAIPTNDFPVNQKETLVTDWHIQWMQIQRTQDEKEKKKMKQLPSASVRNKTKKGSAKNNNDEGGDERKNIILPRRFDVLFGRGRYTRQHTGNLRAAHLVEMHWNRYEKANKFEKTEIAERIVAIIHESYGRFLKWDDSQGWVEVSFDTAREKVSHFFRHLRSSRKASTAPATTTATDSSSVTTASSSSDSDDSSESLMKQKNTRPRKVSVVDNNYSKSKKLRPPSIAEEAVALDGGLSTTTNSSGKTTVRAFTTTNGVINIGPSSSKQLATNIVGVRRVSVC